MKNTANESGRDMRWYLDRIEYLAGFMTPERERSMRRVVEERTRYMTVCMENTYYAHNASALVRHCDAFGLQDIYTVEELCKFNPSEDVAKGTDRWLTFHRSRSTAEAVAALRAGGYRIVATMPHSGDITPERFDVDAGPFALVFGTELQGISDEMAGAADHFLRIPMCGFVESLNVSAAAAILICMLSARVRSTVEGWRLDEDEKARILFEWMARSVRSSGRLLERYDPYEHSAHREAHE